MMKRAVLLTLLLLSTGCGTDIAGPSSSLLSCVFGDGVGLAPGDVLQVRGAGNQALCFTPGAGVGEYVFIPFYAVDRPDDDERAATIEVEITGSEFRPVEAAAPVVVPPSLVLGRGPSRPRPDPGFERWLRLREIRELEPRIHQRGEGKTGPGERAPARSNAVAAAGVPAVGDLLDLNVAIDCDTEEIRTGRVEHVSQHAIVVADTGNPAGLSAGDYEFFAVTFDTLVYPVDTEHFGVPTDIDGNGRAIIFFTRAVNELTPTDAKVYTAGFFWSGDLFPHTATERLEPCTGGNRAEMFYMLAADPLGKFGIPFSVEDIREQSVGTIAHEFQHLINASRRLYVNEAPRFERPWLNEALSHIAEELVFYPVARLEPGTNLSIEDLRAVPNGRWAFNHYMSSNLTDYAAYLERPDTASLMGVTDLITTRGAGWSFLRYAADRSGRDDAAFFFDLVNSSLAGLENLDAVLGGSGRAFDWMQDWSVSVFADDYVPGLDPRFTQQSWNFRSIFPNSTIGVFPLTSPTLTSAQVFSIDLLPGGAAFPRFAVAGDGRAAVHVEAEGGVPPRTLRGSFVRIQ